MLKRKGQSTVEYALIIAVVVAGLLLMQHYVRRGYAGRLKQASDDMGEQYDPTAYSGNFFVNQHSRTNQIVESGVSSTNHVEDQVSSRTGNEDVAAWGAAENLYSK